MRVVPLALRVRVLALVRAGLSAVGYVAALLVGAASETTLLGWSVGAILVSSILAVDRRGRLHEPPGPLPADATLESWAEIARTDVFPSTIGVSILTLVALPISAALAGMLAGILGGMALMTMVAAVQVALEERKLGGALSFERRSRRLFITRSSARWPRLGTPPRRSHAHRRRWPTASSSSGTRKRPTRSRMDRSSRSPPTTRPRGRANGPGPSASCPEGCRGGPSRPR